MGKQQIIESMQPIIEEAIKKNCWLLNAPQGVILSPSGIRKEMGQGKLLFGPKMWTLIPELAVRTRFYETLAKAQKMVENFEKEAKENLEIISNGNLRKLNASE